MKALIVLFFASTILSGCASGIKMTAQTKVETFNFPSLNKITEASIGDYMLNQGVSTTNNYLQIKQNIDGSMYDIGAGDYKEFGIDNEGKEYFTIYSTNGGYVQNSLLADPPYALHPDKDKGLCISTVFVRNATCYEQAQTEIIKKSVASQDSFQQTLIYNGSVGKKINISYREFKNDMARDAFTNNVEYDMSKSNVIKYKGAKIEVISYDNSTIKFKVLSDFS